ncbi:Protein deglycase DJ-1zDJ-1 [Phlyctochytrium bullatum]|nr:Protein deglycase DJ-1zDJ-1 [Phlyctochytrium bullatum]
MTAGKKVLLLLAKGSEEMETVITADVLRRAKLHVDLVSVGNDPIVECSRHVKIQPNLSLASPSFSSKPYDMVVLPGGLEGAKTFASSPAVHALLRDFESTDRHIAAICAAPMAFAAAGVGIGKRVTSHPVAQSHLTEKYAYVAYATHKEKVVRDGKFVTSVCPGTTFDFALELVEILAGKEVREEVAAGVFCS